MEITKTIMLIIWFRGYDEYIKNLSYGFIFDQLCSYLAQEVPIACKFKKEFLAIRRAISLNATFVLFCWNNDWRN